MGSFILQPFKNLKKVVISVCCVILRSAIIKAKIVKHVKADSRALTCQPAESLPGH